MRPRPWSSAVASILTLAALATASCGPRKPPSTLDTTDLDEKLSTFVYMEDGDLVNFLVDAKTARIHASSPYFPLEICVANRGLKNMTLTRESFTLIDDKGNRYQPASPRELIESYQFLDVDREQAELASIVADRFANFTRYQATFSPTRLPGAAGIVQDRVSVPRWGYIIDFLYFPVPREGLLDRRYELHMDAPELPDPVFVKFAIQ